MSPKPYTFIAQNPITVGTVFVYQAPQGASLCLDCAAVSYWTRDFTGRRNRGSELPGYWITARSERTPITWHEIKEVSTEADGTIWVRLWAEEWPGALLHLVWTIAKTTEHKERARQFLQAKR